MKSLLAFLMFISASTASAMNTIYTDAELTDEALIFLIDRIGDELNGNSHNQEILNMAYNRSRVVRMKLNRFLPKLPGLSAATDSEIGAVLQDIVDELLANSHSLNTRDKSRLHLEAILEKLEENRDVVSELAVLTISESDPFYFGDITLGVKVYTTFTITNHGNGESFFTGAHLPEPFDWYNGSFPGTGGTCTPTLLEGESCTVVMEFYPQTIGFYEAAFQLFYYDGAEVQSLSKVLQGDAHL